VVAAQAGNREGFSGRQHIGSRLLELVVPASRDAWLVTLDGSAAAKLYRPTGWHSLEPTFMLWG